MILKLYLLLFLCFLLKTYRMEAQTVKWNLQECINYGVEHSLTIQQKKLQNDNNRLEVRDAVLNLLPSVSGISPGLSYSFGRGIDPETNTYVNTRYMSFGGFGFGTGITVFAGFSGINRIKIAKISRLMGLKETENQANQIAIQIMHAFFNYLYMKEEVHITEEQVENYRMRLKKIERECDLGKKPKSDLYEMQAQQASMEFLLESSQNNLQNALVNLKYLMNYEEEDEFMVDTLSFEDFSLEQHRFDIDDIYHKAMEELPEITIAKYSVRTAKLNLMTAQANLYPSISMGGSISFGSYSDHVSESFWNQIFDRNRIGKGFSISMSIPFYSGLSKRSGLRKAKNSLTATEIQFLQTQRELYNEIQKALQELESCAQRYRISLQREKFSTLSQSAAQKRYEQGLITIIDLNNTSNNQLEARSEVQKSKFNYIMQKKMIDFYRGIPLQTQVTSPDNFNFRNYK